MRAIPTDGLLSPRTKGTPSYEIKMDGWRVLAFTGTRGIHLQSRHLKPLHPYFPDVVANLDAALLPDTVLDGEIVIWQPDAGRTSFPALQRRITAGRHLSAEARAHPATYVVFDLLQVDGHELVDRPLLERRALLEELCDGLPGITVCPATRDPDEAQDWFDSYSVTGAEGIIIKDLTSRYRANGPGWWKWKRRTTTEAVIGGVLGTLTNPAVLLLGHHQRGRLRYVGRTVPLQAAHRRELAGILTAAVDHPWRNPLPAAWAGNLDRREPVGYLPVNPDQVVEIAVDEAFEYGRWRHPVRYLRVRADLTAADITADPVSPRSAK